MLLTGLQGKDKPVFPVAVTGHTDQTSGNLADIFLGYGKNPEIGPPEIQGISQGLPFTHGNIGSVTSGITKHSQ